MLMQMWNKMISATDFARRLHYVQTEKNDNSETL